jgi:sodium transport system permease protein
VIHKPLLVYGREMLVMVRDRRLVLGVAITSLVVLPALMGFLGNMNRLTGAESELVPVLVLEPDAVMRSALSRVPTIQVMEPGDPAVDTAEGYITVLREGSGYRIVADRTRQRRWAAARDIEAALEEVKANTVRAALESRGVDAGILEPFGVSVMDSSGPNDRGRQLLGTLIPYLVIVLLVANSIRALYIAVGEKEKNTLASLLVSTVSRRAIVVGKSLAIVTFAIFASVLLIVGMVLFANLGFSIGTGGVGSVAFTLSASQVAQLVVNIVSLALLVASIIMLLGTFARTQREAGVYTAPLLFLSIFLAIFSFSDVTWGLQVYAVPILGNSLAMRQTITGNLEWPQLLLPVLSNVAVFGLLLWGAVRLYERETVLFRT